MLIGRVEEVGMYSELCKHTLKVLPPKTSNSIYPYRDGYLYVLIHTNQHLEYWNFENYNA